MEQNTSRDATSVDLIKSWLLDWLAQELRIDREKIDPRQSFLSYGMDSVQAMTMVGDLEANLEVRLPPTLAWDFPDIDALSAHLVDRLTTIKGSAPQASPSETQSVTPPTKIDKSLVVELEEIRDRDVDDVVHPFADSAR
jgi:acyl carrier protein